MMQMGDVRELDCGACKERTTHIVRKEASGGHYEWFYLVCSKCGKKIRVGVAENFRTKGVGYG